MKSFVLASAIAMLSAGMWGAVPSARAVDNPGMNGVYTYRDDDGAVGTWTIETSCDPGCVAHVTTGPGQGFDAPFVNGRYVNSRIIPDVMDCPLEQIGETFIDPGNESLEVVQWWDPVTLAGEVDFIYRRTPCHVPDYHDKFTLTPVG